MRRVALFGRSALELALIPLVLAFVGALIGGALAAFGGLLLADAATGATFGGLAGLLVALAKKGPRPTLSHRTAPDRSETLGYGGVGFFGGGDGGYGGGGCDGGGGGGGC